MNISYTKINDYEIPNLKIEEKEKYNIGKYGLLKLKYLKNNQRILYYDLLIKNELNEYLSFLEEAKERDHRKIGRDLDLFCFSDYVVPGLPLYTPRGTIVDIELQKEIERVCRRYGFQKVSCPSLADISLFEIF